MNGSGDTASTSCCIDTKQRLVHRVLFTSNSRKPHQNVLIHSTMVLSSRDPEDHRKPCTVCSTPRDVLLRCQIDESAQWHFVCPGKCWKQVSGGVVDGDAEHPHYRYGGMWKNKAAGVSAKRPKKTKKGKEVVRDWDGRDCKYTVNDLVAWNGFVWSCRKSHYSREEAVPEKEIGLWKEQYVLQDSAEEDAASG